MVKTQKATLLEFKEMMGADNQEGIIFKFKSFHDGIFNYYAEIEKSTFEVSIIADDTFLDDEILIDLLEKKRIKYISGGIYEDDIKILDFELTL